MGIVLIPNANEKVKELVAAPEIYDFYESVQECYDDFKREQWKVSKAKRKDIEPSSVFTTSMQSLITKVGLVISNVASANYKLSYDTYCGLESANCFEALSYLCCRVLSDNALDNNFKELNKYGNIGKHTIGDVRCDADLWVQKYNELIKKLAAACKLPALKKISIKMPVNTQKASGAKSTATKTRTEPGGTPVKGNAVPSSTAVKDSSPSAYASAGSDGSSGMGLGGQYSEYDYGSSYYSVGDILKWVLIGAAATTVIIGIILLCVFSKRIMWWQWQHIIGSLAGAVITAACVFLVWFLDDEAICDIFLPGTILLGVILVTNIVLLSVYQPLYKIICIWINGYAIAAGAVLCISSFCDDEKIYGFIQLGEIGGCLLVLLLSALLL